MANSWLTSDDIINAVKRRISFPLYQSTFTDQEILDFGNDVIKEELLPNVMSYHQEFFVTSSAHRVLPHVSNYPIPNRAIGMKLREVLYGDGNTQNGLPYGNLFDMTRVNADDKAWFQAVGITQQVLYRFYIENNNVVIAPPILDAPQGVLVMYWFIRPNQLVETSRSFIINGFSKTVTITNTSISAGDTVTLTTVTEVLNALQTNYFVFTAVTGAPIAFQFQIGATASNTATNLSTAINNANLGFSANNGSPATNTVKIVYTERTRGVTSSNSVGLLVQTTLGLESVLPVPANITSGSYVDLLQTLPGHKIINYDVLVPLNSVSGLTLSLDEEDVPDEYVIGDYVCSRNECIIPFLPPELHSSLVQRICSRVLQSIGDTQGMQISDATVQKLDKTEGNLIEDRVDGQPQKVLNRHSILRYNSFVDRRRY